MLSDLVDDGSIHELFIGLASVTERQRIRNINHIFRRTVMYGKG